MRGFTPRVYVANFRTDSTIPCDRLPYALNTHLPPDVVVSQAREVHEGFNAIGSCVRKSYTYLIYNDRIRNPFYVDRVWFYSRHLDEAVMQAAADQFVGTHDFAAVRSVGTDVRSTVRTVYQYQVQRQGKLLALTVSADGFFVQHGAGHGGDRGVCSRREIPAGCHRRHPGRWEPDGGGTHSPGRGPVSHAPVV